MNYFISLFNFIMDIAYSTHWLMLNGLLFLFAFAGIVIKSLRGKYKKFYPLWVTVIVYQIFVAMFTFGLFFNAGIPSFGYTIIFGMLMPFILASLMSLKFFGQGFSSKVIVKSVSIIWVSFTIVGFFVLSITAMIWVTI